MGLSDVTVEQILKYLRLEFDILEAIIKEVE